MEVGAYRSARGRGVIGRDPRKPGHPGLHGKVAGRGDRAGEAGLLDRSTGRKRDARCDADVFEGQSAGATRRGLGPHWQEGRDKQGSEGRTERQDTQHLQVRSVDGEAVLASAARRGKLGPHRLTQK
ncbi:hypothetical protein R2601_02853 [Salipiger bermudensis HTCC2601]|uniref:Uncharacterized protein n=1 Tax=Salipiger bermudensis (strain DSM 26914 / JCM 13377 / KCTC 12554 / HTCC2601) TaxID=314265 RepID=Q0FWS5_SALBH|nr:hypothetical protein R2601_02853 [Salipiger bermudensis HTCC2601]